MSGHSKWSTIKRKKEKIDNKRGKIFTKIGREIAVAVKEGGPDPNTNNRLRECVAKAKANNMPNDNIQRSIKRAAGESGSINYETNIYEGYGEGGVAVIVETLTDNKNRTAADVRHAFAKGNGSIGASGCVSWMFDKKGVIVIENNGEIDEDELTMTAIDAGADDFQTEDDAYTVLTDPADFSAVLETLEEAGYQFLSAEVSMIPQNTVDVTPEQEESIEKLLDLLEDNDDVQNVYHNANLSQDDDE